MSYYQDDAWWDTRFKIRTPIVLEPQTLEPGKESLSSVKLNKKRINNKIKSDYSDLNVIYQPDGVTFSGLPSPTETSSSLDQGTFDPGGNLIFSGDNLIYDGDSLNYGGVPVPSWDGPEGYSFVLHDEGFVTGPGGELLTWESP